ncbi:MAG TPA: DUF1318 domain-containing protein [bacterium]
MKAFVRWILPLFLLMAGCSIKPPELKLTGEKTTLEMEIIGTYHQMREDTWMVASTRSASEPKKAPISAEKKKVLEALQQQAFNKDDIEEFKQKGYVGENNEGLLTYGPTGAVQVNAEQAALMQDVVQEENQCRQLILQRVVELNDALKKALPKDVLAVFAKMYQENSSKGTWIQTPAGNWIKKESVGGDAR